MLVRAALGTIGPVAFVGNATEDSAFFVKRLPSDDQVSSAHKIVSCLGGRGVVPALVAGALGIRAELCTVVGDDRRTTFTDFLSANRVGTSGVKWDTSNLGVTRYVAFVRPDLGTTAAVAYRPALDWHPIASQHVLVAGAQATYFSTNDLSFNRELFSSLAEGVPVLHNLGIRLEEDAAYLALMLDRCTIIIGNRHEVTEVTRVSGLTPPNIFDHSRSLQHLIVTAGRNGAQVFTRGATASVAHPAIHVQVDALRSPVGAGDSFAVGILWSVLVGADIHDGVALGMRLGALAAQSEESYPDLRAVSEISL
ncbi:MAG: carbohydrate kinase family protein [Candidatus Rokuibacteriota bacterium]